jgi:Leucine-rich repeat (LRR) protein
LILIKNQINEIDTNGFQGLENIEEINLSGNQLTKIEATSFQHLSKLKKIDLRFNRITELDTNGFSRANNFIEIFYLQGNCIKYPLSLNSDPWSKYKWTMDHTGKWTKFEFKE